MKYIYNGKIDPEIQDALAELGNVGVGLASVALEKMLGTGIAIGIPRVTPAAENIEAIVADDPEKVGIGILMSLESEITGSVLFVIDSEFMSMLVGKLVSKELHGEELVEDIDSLSAIQEIGNIMAASYMKSLGTYTGIDIYLAPVMVGVDMIGALISYPLALLGISSSETVCIDTSFSLMSDDNRKSVGRVLMFPDENSLNRIIDALNG